MKNINNQRIMLSHGNGGKLSHELYGTSILSAFANNILSPLSDSAILDNPNCRLAFSTDSFVVKPIFFPGGDIGKLAVCGTINDLSVSGSIPRFLSCSFIIEEGFFISDLERIIDSMAQTARSCGVKIVTGDTKVVEKGSADSIFINTAGIGVFSEKTSVFSPDRIKNNDVIIINGTIGEHGMAILTAREKFPITTGISSDCAPLSDLINKVLQAVPEEEIRIMRDPTRGGVATTLNELIEKTRFSMEIVETKLPIMDNVMAICEMTGYDPLYIANEGKVIVIASESAGELIIDAMHRHPLGKEARIIGKITESHPGRVILKTSIGGERIVDMLSGEMFPRIC
jgi:hydrogenase expression/formation protein HypE